MNDSETKRLGVKMYPSPLGDHFFISFLRKTFLIFLTEVIKRTYAKHIFKFSTLSHFPSKTERKIQHYKGIYPKGRKGELVWLGLSEDILVIAVMIISTYTMEKLIVIITKIAFLTHYGLKTISGRSRSLQSPKT